MTSKTLLAAAAAAGVLLGCGQPEPSQAGGAASRAQEPAAERPAPDTPAPESTGGMGSGAGRMSEMHEGMMGGGRSGEAPEATASGASSADCPDASQELVEQGRTVFGGAGNCYTCHGPDATGTPLAPDLTDGEWLNVDGSYGQIAQLVRTGVASPKQHPAPMPPMGGGNLSADQVCAVAAYVHSLSQ